MPALALGLGAVIVVAYAAGGRTGDGLGAFGVMAAVALLFALGGRSETLRGLGGPGRDERWAMIDLRASATGGLMALTFAVGAWLWEIAHGRDGSEFALVCTVGGVGYLVAVAVLRRRS